MKKQSDLWKEVETGGKLTEPTHPITSYLDVDWFPLGSPHIWPSVATELVGSFVKQTLGWILEHKRFVGCNACGREKEEEATLEGTALTSGG